MLFNNLKRSVNFNTKLYIFKYDFYFIINKGKANLLTFHHEYLNKAKKSVKQLQTLYL